MRAKEITGKELVKQQQLFELLVAFAKSYGLESTIPAIKQRSSSSDGTPRVLIPEALKEKLQRIELKVELSITIMETGERIPTVKSVDTYQFKTALQNMHRAASITGKLKELAGAYGIQKDDIHNHTKRLPFSKDTPFAIAIPKTLEKKLQEKKVYILTNGNFLTFANEKELEKAANEATTSNIRLVSRTGALHGIIPLGQLPTELCAYISHLATNGEIDKRKAQLNALHTLNIPEQLLQTFPSERAIITVVAHANTNDLRQLLIRGPELGQADNPDSLGAQLLTFSENMVKIETANGNLTQAGFHANIADLLRKAIKGELQAEKKEYHLALENRFINRLYGLCRTEEERQFIDSVKKGESSEVTAWLQKHSFERHFIFHAKPEIGAALESYANRAPGMVYRQIHSALKEADQEVFYTKGQAIAILEAAAKDQSSPFKMPKASKLQHCLENVIKAHGEEYKTAWEKSIRIQPKEINPHFITGKDIKLALHNALLSKESKKEPQLSPEAISQQVDQLFRRASAAVEAATAKPLIKLYP